MIKKFEVCRIKSFIYLIEVYNTNTRKIKYITSIGKKIKVDYELNPESNNIIKCYDNLKEALSDYEK
jgi:hypothetical protein